MADPPRVMKVGSIVWAIVIGIGVIVLAGSIILPSTKRSHLDFKTLEQMRQRQMLDNDATNSAVPATQP